MGSVLNNHTYFPGSFNGCLATISAHELGKLAIEETLKRSNVKGEEVHEVIIGQVLTAGITKHDKRTLIYVDHHVKDL